MAIKKANSTANKGLIRKDMIFIISIVTLPVLMWAILYIGGNLNMILLAFQEYDSVNKTYYFSGINNFSKFFNDLFNDELLLLSAKNSFTVYGIDLFIQMPISLLVSYFIYKRIYGAGFFRIVLFLPSIVSGMVWVLIYKYLVEYGVPAVFPGIKTSLLTNDKTAFGVMLAYTIWIGFAGSMVLYTGAMSKVPQDLVEYGKIDGLNFMQELWHLTLPCIFPTITVFLVTGVSGIFTSQLALYSFYGANAPKNAYTFGYYFFRAVFGNAAKPAEFPYASAAGMAFTLVVAPITLLVRHLLEKYGPSAEF